MTDTTTPLPPPPPKEAGDASKGQENGGEEEKEEDVAMPPAPAPPAASAAGVPAATVAAVAVAAPAQTGGGKRSPSDFLKTVLGRPVVVKLNSGIDYRGVLVCLDGYMNIAMEQTEEYVNGQLKATFGDCFIRGNNVLYISTQRRR
ncbi:unnamed protein product [Ectocarpus sp. CCAP 1310/34]|nr:unnamed protein product [Ectocarpus sp. CCAP 1310/34]